MRLISPIIALLLLLVSSSLAQESAPSVHPLFSDHMVLQRGKQVPVWGTASPGASVTVEFAGSKKTVTAEANGTWLAKIGPFKASSTGRKLRVSGAGDHTFKDILVGDVWICSGQSNMEWPVAASNDAQQEIAAASHSGVRLFTVPKRISLTPQQTVDGQWSVCTPDSIPGFSAVGYFFGRELNRELNIPIGLIHTSWGGTVAEAWTSAEALANMTDFEAPLQQLAANATAVADGSFDLEERVNAWWQENAGGSKLAAADVRHSDWKTMQLPQNWEDANVGLDGFDGIVWFRTEFELPASWQGKDVVLNLGEIDDADTTWVNGHEVGSTNGWNQKRNYKIDAKHLKTGRNVIAIRVFDGNGGGGIYGKDTKLAVTQSDDKSQAIELATAWHFQVGPKLADLPPFPQSFTNNPNNVTVLYNGMLAPLKPFGITGAIWYQGESNAGRAEQYRELLPTMIADWRDRFEQGDFPFLIVQLANFMQAQTTPVQSGWAELREAQQMTADRDPQTGIAITTDIGEALDIHPRNKQDVGKRLALQALEIQYKKNVAASGPTVKDMGILGDSLFIEFNNVGDGLVAHGEKLKGFAIAEATGEFVWADAEIRGNTVLLWNEDLAEPIRVRYNWANNPVGNLFNKNGLPAAPFRTDRR